MQDLKVIGVENGALLAANEDGERYRIAIDEVLQSRLKQNRPEQQAPGPKLSPREIQAHIRSGMSAEEVSAVTGASLEYIQRFESPIIAEREHVVSSALGVPVHTTADVDPLGEPATFGTVIRDRLASLGASGERWASWKEQEGGWIVKLSFTADEIDHDARWGYEQRKNALAPLNSEAVTLSQQGEMQGGLIPRLRAVAPSSTAADDSRFDSAAFTFPESAADGSDADAVGRLEPFSYGRTVPVANNSIAVTAINRSQDEAPGDMHQTADLLETLRKRRGEREAATFPAGDDEPGSPGQIRPGQMRMVDVPLDDFTDLDRDSGRGDSGRGDSGRGDSGRGDSGKRTRQSSNATGPVGGTRGGKRARASMPSWDEIVFGARTDDDLA